MGKPLVNSKQGITRREGQVFWYGYYVSEVKRDCVSHKEGTRPSHFYVVFLFFSTFATFQGFLLHVDFANRAAEHRDIIEVPCRVCNEPGL
ncbi:MAG: hypothetical protein FJ123_06140 [Deltaproteobacteria bacterium]|nr:hypothetical protein [Deltaproteobacteria bacterium]